MVGVLAAKVRFKRLNLGLKDDSFFHDVLPRYNPCKDVMCIDGQKLLPFTPQ